jgi:hypothetical protein
MGRGRSGERGLGGGEVAGAGNMRRGHVDGPAASTFVGRGRAWRISTAGGEAGIGEQQRGPSVGESGGGATAAAVSLDGSARVRLAVARWSRAYPMIPQTI